MRSTLDMYAHSDIMHYFVGQFDLLPITEASLSITKVNKTVKEKTVLYICKQYILEITWVIAVDQRILKINVLLQ